MKVKEFFEKVFRWESGRQNTSYDKMLLLTGSFPIPFDIYLLRFPEGSEILEHVDKVEQGKHYRLNIIVKKAKVGGEFKSSSTIWASERVKLFRSDSASHSVSKIEKGNRYVLSCGWIRKD